MFRCSEFTFLTFCSLVAARCRHMQIHCGLVCAERSHAGQERQTL